MHLQFLERIRRIAASASGLVGNRLALFSLELQDELERQFGHFILLLVTTVFAALCVLFASLFVLVLGWQAGHLAATAAGLTLLHAAFTAACWHWWRRRMETAPRPFEATITEFELDLETLHKTREGRS